MAAAAVAALEAAWPVRVESELPGGKGRGLVAARALRAGETVLRELPTLLVTTHAAAAATCARCCRQPDARPNFILPLACPGLCSGSSRYCSDACLEAHAAALHRPIECAALGAMLGDGDGDGDGDGAGGGGGGLLETEEERDACRFLIAALALRERTRQQQEDHHKSSDIPPTSPPTTTSGLFDGYSREVLPPGGYAALERLFDPVAVDEENGVVITPEERRVYEAVSDALVGGEVKVTVEEAAALLRKDRCNSYGIMARSSSQLNDNQRDIRGSGVYASAALLNHDCLPNVCRFDRFDDPSCVDQASNLSNAVVEIRAMHDVEEGMELKMSYFPINQTYTRRQRRLKEEYGFDCDCQRCRVESTWSDEEEEEEAEVGGRAGGDEGGDGFGAGKSQQANGAEQGNGDDDDQDDDDDNDADPVDDFPHMMFFARYLCPSDACGGTLCPEEGTYHEREDPRGNAFWDRYDYVESGVMECNMCGRKRTEAEFLEEMARLGEERDDEDEEGYAEIESDASE